MTCLRGFEPCNYGGELQSLDLDLGNASPTTSVGAGAAEVVVSVLCAGPPFPTVSSEVYIREHLGTTYTMGMGVRYNGIQWACNNLRACQVKQTLPDIVLSVSFSFRWHKWRRWPNHRRWLHPLNIGSIKVRSALVSGCFGNTPSKTWLQLQPLAALVLGKLT